jgi:hypothetical protein
MTSQKDPSPIGRSDRSKEKLNDLIRGDRCVAGYPM